MRKIVFILFGLIITQSLIFGQSGSIFKNNFLEKLIIENNNNLTFSILEYFNEEDGGYEFLVSILGGEHENFAIVYTDDNFEYIDKKNIIINSMPKNGSLYEDSKKNQKGDLFIAYEMVDSVFQQGNKNKILRVYSEIISLNSNLEFQWKFRTNFSIQKFVVFEDGKLVVSAFEYNSIFTRQSDFDKKVIVFGLDSLGQILWSNEVGTSPTTGFIYQGINIDGNFAAFSFDQKSDFALSNLCNEFIDSRVFWIDENGQNYFDTIFKVRGEANYVIIPKLFNVERSVGCLKLIYQPEEYSACLMNYNVFDSTSDIVLKKMRILYHMNQIELCILNDGKEPKNIFSLSNVDTSGIFISSISQLSSGELIVSGCKGEFPMALKLKQNGEIIGRFNFDEKINLGLNLPAKATKLVSVNEQEAVFLLEEKGLIKNVIFLKEERNDK